jgi:hypothetical protein
MSRVSSICRSSLVASIMLSSTTLSAQGPDRAPSRLLPRVSVAVAFDARNKLRGDPEMNLGLASLEWPTRVTGLTFRVDGIYAHRDRIDRQQQPCIACDRIGNGYAYFTSRVTAAGGMAGVSYDLRRRRALRPYLLAGAGAVQTHDKFTAGTTPSFICTTVCVLPATGPSVVRNDRPLSGAAQVGAGIVYSWRWVSAVAETRYMAVAYANTRGLNGAVPVSLGVRF